MKQRIAKLSCLVVLLSLTSYTWAMETMDDSSLSNQAGQEGVDIALGFTNSTISYDQVLLTDKDGFTGTTNAASLVIAPNNYSASTGINLLDSAGTALNSTTSPIVIKFDTDANGTAPVFNANIAFPSALGIIRLTPFSIYLASGNTSIFSPSRTSGAGTLRSSGVTKIVGFTNNLDIKLKSSLGINVQLGNTPQGHLLRFNAGSIDEISTTGLNLYSKTGTNAEASSLNLDLNIKASNSTNGFRLFQNGTFSGFYADIVSDGVTFGADGTTDKFDVTVSNVIAGCSTGCSNAATFSGLKNASIGNFGVVGASVNNLRVNVKGM